MAAEASEPGAAETADATTENAGEATAEADPRDRADLTRTVLVGAATGGALGAAIGAWAAFARVMWPERVDQVIHAVVEGGREIGTAAASAAGGTLDTSALGELLPGKNGNGRRSAAVKRNAKQAAAAAARAARDTIVAMGGERNDADEQDA